MLKIAEMKEQRAGRIAEMRKIHEDAKGGELEGETRSRFDALDVEVSALNKRIADAEKLAEFERYEASAEPVSGGAAERRSLDRYSLVKALKENRNGKLTGVEAEWHQELAKDRAEVRGVMVPTEIIFGGERRALTTTTPVSGPGSNLIATDLAAMTDRRRARLKIEMMGATVLRGLRGNIDLPRLASSATAGWIAEHTDATASDASFGKKSMTPKTIAAESELSRRLLEQANEAIEGVVRADLAYMLSQGLDLAAIQGGGTNEPTGILTDTDVTSVTGGAFDSDITANLIAALETDDVTGTTGFLTNPAVMNAARKTKDVDGRVIPLSELFHGERVEASTQVPGDIGGTNDKNALIFGEWAGLYLGYWSGVDLLMNPYHSDVASKGGAKLHAFLDCDVVVRHPEGFRYAEID